MSQEGVQSFLKKLAEDAELLSQLESLEAPDLEGHCRQVAEVAKAAGFEVSHEEAREVIEVHSSEELGEDELERVAGGFSLSSGKAAKLNVGQKYNVGVKLEMDPTKVKI